MTTFKSNRTWAFLLPTVFAIIAAGLVYRSMSQPAPLQEDLFIPGTNGISDTLLEAAQSLQHPADGSDQLPPITIDYPFEKSVFPPDIVAPTFLWHDGQAEADRWLIDISFKGSPYHIYAITEGKQPELIIDELAISSTNDDYQRPDYDVSAKAWTPDEQLWQMIKHSSVENDATVTLYGLSSKNPDQLLSKAALRITTSSDPVDAPIFYRDVPLMPHRKKEGGIQPMDPKAFSSIAWRFRDISQASAPVVLTDMPTCANCHSFSADGSVLGMDMDGPQGDKGAYGLKDIEKDMVIDDDDIISWNSYEGTPEGHNNFGLFSRVSPDGRYVVSTLNESVFVVNYPNFEFLQSFYPTRGILVVYDRKTGEMKPLPGADNPFFVQSNATWSPDGKELVFSRAIAKNNFENKELPTFAGDDRETFIQYDLYRIPFNNGKGGIPKPVTGASGNRMSNSFPIYSPDGKWIVFVQTEKGQLMRPDSKLYIIPAEGGTARKLDCNLDPMNSWHSWSPNSRWLVFSSKGMGPFTKMFLTHIDKHGNDTPAILIPNSTAANRAVNIPEFANGAGDAIHSISAPTQRSLGFYKRAIRRQTTGKTAEALHALDQSIEANPYNADAYRYQGELLFKTGQAEKAVARLKKAAELDPKAPDAYNNIAHILRTQGNPEAAVSYLNDVLQKHPDLPEVHYQLGKLYRDTGQIDPAIEHYQQASTLDPSRPEFLNGLGVALRIALQYDKAIRLYQQSLALRPGQPDVLYELGRAHQLQKNTRTTAEYYQKAIAIDGSAGARFYLARILRDKKEFSGCIEQLNALLRLQPQNIQALNSLAWVLAAYQNNPAADPERAVQLAQKACDLTGSKIPALLDTLAVSLAAAGHYEKAASEAKKALQILSSGDDNQLSKKIRQRMSLFTAHQPYTEPAD